MKTAYVVLSHRSPEQVLRLVRTLRTAGPVVLHHDDRVARLDEAALHGVERVLPPTPVAWGWASQLETLLRCLRHALARVEFEWLVVLSGQDYPIRPLDEIDASLREGGFDGYVEGVPVSPPEWSRDAVDEFARRYFYRYRAVRPPGPALRRAVSVARPLVTLRDMPWGTVLGVRGRGPGLPVRRGSDWLTLSRRAVEVVADAAPDLIRHYRRTVSPTESLPHTVLYADPTLRLSGDTRRFSKWEPGALHPAVLGMDDLDAILASGADFARKFEDPRVLDALDSVVLG